ncbi:DUF3667 domain-containing protein [Prolixibacteraceae bacterium JC049]|nr:DUF3667 domain-containing protein [Prolixibacteraceae bacterium JC049]
MKWNLNLKWYSKFKETVRKKLEPTMTDEEHCCKNCETEFKGNFCPNCGQSILEMDRPFSFIIYDFMGNMFAFDSRFFRSLYTLMFRPGRLTRDFVEGKRQRYMSPLKLYVFVSFVFFLLMSIGTKRLVSDLDKMEDKAAVELNKNQNKQVADTLVKDLNDVLHVEIIKNNPSDSALAKKLQIPTQITETLKDTIQQGYHQSKWAAQLEKELIRKQDSWSEKEKKLARKAINMLDYPDFFIAEYFKYFSWALFLLMPIFALILKLLYIRRRVNYIRHFIFAINIHALNFIVLSLVFASSWLLSDNYQPYALNLLWAIPLYLYLGMRRFYKQSRRKTIFKIFILVSLYNLVLLLALIAVGYYAFINA